jgi:hypothetical protein
MIRQSMMGTPTANAAPRGSVLRRMKDCMTNPEDDFDRSPNPGEMVYFFSQSALMATPRKTDADRGGRGDVLSQLRGYPSKHAGMSTRELLPTHRASEAHHGPDMTSHSPNLKARMLNDNPKWAGARALATLLQSHGLSGTTALPVTYGWMMGFPPGWLARALRSAVLAGHLQQVSSSKRSVTPSSPKSQKP